MSSLLKIYEDNPDDRAVREVVECLNRGGVIVCPTDTVYSFACLLGNSKGFDRIARLKGLKPEKAHFSLLCSDLSDLSTYTQHLSNTTFKTMKRVLPGPYTFVLPASNQGPKLYKSPKKTIGLRVPDLGVALAILKALDKPLVASVHDDDDVLEYTTNPELIDERWGHAVDMTVDGGIGHLHASTVVDCTGDEPKSFEKAWGTWTPSGDQSRPGPTALAQRRRRRDPFWQTRFR